MIGLRRRRQSGLAAPARVVVLGGGFGGLFAARAILKRAGQEASLTVWLVSAQERFVFKPLLYELLTDEVDEDDIAPPLRSVLTDSRVRHVRAEVRRIDLAGCSVSLTASDGPEELSFDSLVIALGARPDLYGIEGLADHARTAATLEDFLCLRAHIDEVGTRCAALQPGREGERLRTVAIVGAGASGVEVACKLAAGACSLQRGWRVVLVEAAAGILPGFGEEVKEAARTALADLGVELWLETEVVRAGDLGLVLCEGGRVNPTEEEAGTEVDETQLATTWLYAGTIVWTAGTKVSAGLEGLDVPKDASGRVLVPGTLEVPGHNGVFVLGDAARCAVEGSAPPPASAQVAVQQASVVGRNVLARLHGKTLRSFRYLPLAETLSLGVGADVLQLPGVLLRGRSGQLLRRLVYLYRLPGRRHRATVAVRWFVRGLMRGLSK